ncbi:hypothetical protein, partial [Rhizobium sp. N122]|uniref:hypothetical protein n=1 Tax=Rhizobium sp. N122 TaxID=1764272 RepID=UPI001AECF8D3
QLFRRAKSFDQITPIQCLQRIAHDQDESLSIITVKTKLAPMGLDPRIHAALHQLRAWIPGSRPGMTEVGGAFSTNTLPIERNICA